MEIETLRTKLLAAVPDYMAEIAPGPLIRRYLEKNPAPPLPAGPKALLSLGKAAGAMTATLADTFDVAPAHTLSILPEGYPPPPPSYPLFWGSHPLPDRRSLEAFERLREFIHTLPDERLLVVALSGGSSSLVVQPLPPVGLEDKVSLSKRLIESGAPIETVNALRIHLSSFKGGGLARMIGSRPSLTYILSDIPGDGASLVGSSPMFSVLRDGPGMLSALELWLGDTIPEPVRRLLLSLPSLPPPPPASQALFGGVLASSKTLISAMQKIFLPIAPLSGLPLHILSEELCGEAREVGRVLASQIRWHAPTHPEGALWAASGETTVTLFQGSPGRGGRTQELALSLALSLSKTSALVLSLASDGSDGNSGLAGALLPSAPFCNPRLAHEGQEALSRHDSGEFLERHGWGIRTGPSGTNLNDLLMVVYPPSSPPRSPL